MAYDKTILYYTSNRENSEFEQKIIDNIIAQKGDLSIVSVSQKPLDFGKNICVGEVGLSYVNEWKQILIGAKEITTTYIIMAESDFLYPSEYFQFEPKGNVAYRYDNIWILWKEGLHKARRKSSTEGAMIVRKDYIIPYIEDFLKDYPDWMEGKVKLPSVLPFEMFHGDIPCISFKTGDGVRKNTNHLQGQENKASILPYWGHVDDIRRRFL